MPPADTATKFTYNMADSDSPVFLVDGYSDPVILRINGRASYLNCAPVNDFFKHVITDGKREAVVDFANCTAMDSTFLGTLAGAALDFRKQSPPAKLTLVRLGKRNLELVRNLGLHRILDVECDEKALSFDDSTMSELQSIGPAKHATADGMLRAHENLIEADKGNSKKFQDVIAYLRLQVEKDKSGNGAD